MGTQVKPKTNNANEYYQLGKDQCTGNDSMANTANPVVLIMKKNNLDAKKKIKKNEELWLPVDVQM